MNAVSQQINVLNKKDAVKKLEESFLEPSILIRDPRLVLKVQKHKVYRHLKAQTRRIKDEIAMLNRYISLYTPQGQDSSSLIDSHITNDLEYLERHSKLVRKIKPMLT